MKTFKNILTTLCLVSLGWVLQAQELTQNIRGTILDSDSKMPLIGANIMVQDIDPVMGASTDIDGYFKMENVPVGRHTLVVTYLGYEPTVMNSILLTTGKELVLNIELTESTEKLEEVVVTAKLDKNKPLNEMALVSARSFSVEETSRYASSYFDPARMAQNYAGVNLGGGDDDLFNEIIVRGNSPRGIMWRLEGIEIPNPNHFGALGNSGGAISMLSSSTLSNSDFYTGAFPAEFGNATSGVFDLHMRNGNNEKREYAFMLGALGIEAAMEGPFSKNSRASYLFNYRYSTLAMLESLGVSPVEDILPKYQDLSFKINVPTKKAGVFSLFGLGGDNTASFVPEADSTKWESSGDRFGFVENQKMGVVGLSHKMILSESSYLKTVASASHELFQSDEYELLSNEDYRRKVENESTFKSTTFRVSTTYTNKLNAKNTIRLGAIASNTDFNYELKEFIDRDNAFRVYLDNDGTTQLYQAFAQWKHRVTKDWTFNAGMHLTRFALSGENVIEPRLSTSYKLNSKQSISAAIGLHSKPEPIAFYFLESSLPDGTRTSPNLDLGMSKSFHSVLGYDHQLSDNLRLKAEVYYQQLYNVPVTQAPNEYGSIINANDIWDIIGAQDAVNEGEGRNYGIDLTFEKFFSNQYYFLVTGSLFQSKYTPIDGIEYSTKFNSNFQTNLLAGKEWKIGKNKNDIIAVNGKFILAGGNRYTPVDIEKSREQQRTIRDFSQIYGERLSNYLRFDLGVSYKIIKKRMTHSIMVDIQNVTNNQNPGGSYYDRELEKVQEYYLTGFFPVFNYRIEF